VGERSTVGGGDDAADRGRILDAERRVEREHLARGGEVRLGDRQRDPGLQAGGHVTRIKGGDLGEPGRGQAQHLGVVVGGDGPPRLGLRTADPDHTAVCVRGRERAGNLLETAGRDLGERGHIRSAIPARSRGWAR
jgi:hypothetical protein